LARLMIVTLASCLPRQPSYRMCPVAVSKSGLCCEANAARQLSLSLGFRDWPADEMAQRSIEDIAGRVTAIMDPLHLTLSKRPVLGGEAIPKIKVSEASIIYCDEIASKPARAPRGATSGKRSNGRHLLDRRIQGEAHGGHHP